MGKTKNNKKSDAIKIHNINWIWASFKFKILPLCRRFHLIPVYNTRIPQKEEPGWYILIQVLNFKQFLTLIHYFDKHNINISQFWLNEYIKYMHLKVRSQLHLAICWLQALLLHILTAAWQWRLFKPKHVARARRTIKYYVKYCETDGPLHFSNLAETIITTHMEVEREWKNQVTPWSTAFLKEVTVTLLVTKYT